jgi:hypothetical protein
MTKAADKFEPEMLQVRWILNRLDAEELVLNAVRALEHGYDGTALRQLAGLDKPANRDLGNLPERAFTEMGLKPCDRNHAESFLIARDSSLRFRLCTRLFRRFQTLHLAGVPTLRFGLENPQALTTTWLNLSVS